MRIRKIGLAVLVMLLMACSLVNLQRAEDKPGEPSKMPEVVQPSLPPGSESDLLLRPEDLEYLGAFRLPQGGERPYTFAYGGSAMTYSPDGDPNGKLDGYPGSLFISGHDRLPYGELPDGSQVAEVTIPAPVKSKDLNQLNQAEFIQDFQDVARGFFTGLEEIPRLGMLYLNRPETGPIIHLTWGQHLQEEKVPSHAWFNSNLSQAELQGEWYMDDLSPNSVNGYLFEIPQDWADRYIAGFPIATGRFKDGGWSGMGPALIAYRPQEENGSAPPAGAHLEAIPLLLYASSQESMTFEHAMAGYQHPDEWEGGAWLISTTGKSAVIFAGTKSTGKKFWYGWVNPLGPEAACVEKELAEQFTVCYLANGDPCAPGDMKGCSGHNDFRGWWSPRWDAQIIFYNPADLARVATGEVPPWQPQPYAALDVDEFLFLNPAGVELDNLGRGDQRRYRIGEVAYDRLNGLLFILELFADEAQPVVHVWRIQ